MIIAVQDFDQQLYRQQHEEYRKRAAHELSRWNIQVSQEDDWFDDQKRECRELHNQNSGQCNAGTDQNRFEIHIPTAKDRHGIGVIRGGAGVKIGI